MKKLFSMLFALAIGGAVAAQTTAPAEKKQEKPAPAKTETKAAPAEKKAEAKPAKAEAKPAKAEAKPAKAEAKPAKAEAKPAEGTKEEKKEEPKK